MLKWFYIEEAGTGLPCGTSRAPHFLGASRTSKWRPFRGTHFSPMENFDFRQN